MVSRAFTGCNLSFQAVPGPTPYSQFRAAGSSQLDISPELHEKLLSQSNPQLFCLTFFKALRITVHGGTRCELKRRYYRLTLNKGEAIFEVPIETMWIARRVVALKAVQAFSATLAQEWLQRYRKLASSLREYL